MECGQGDAAREKLKGKTWVGEEEIKEERNASVHGVLCKGDDASRRLARGSETLISNSHEDSLMTES